MIANPAQLNIQRRLTELGRIRLGDKGSKGQPQKLNRFRLTSASRPILEAAARMYGGTVRAWQGAPDDGMWELYTETDALDIMVPPVVNAYSQLYEIWDAGGCTLRCDGSWESIAGEACSHDHAPEALGPDGKEWRVTTRVSVILPKLPGLGTWRLETHGWNAAATLPAAVDMLSQASRTGWLPAILRLQQQSSKKKVNGRSQTFRFVVPVIDIIGFTFAELFAGQDEIGAPIAAPQLGAGAIVEQQSPVGPSRPPRGTKVDRPALGPAPDLPERSDFRKPEPPPAAAAPPLAAPTTVGGWTVEEPSAPNSAADAPEAASGTPTPPPPADGQGAAAAAATEVEDGDFTLPDDVGPDPITYDVFKDSVHAAGIPGVTLQAVFHRLHGSDLPAVAIRDQLTDVQRGDLLAAVVAEHQRNAVTA